MLLKFCLCLSLISFINAFIDFIKSFLVERETKSKIRALEEVRALEKIKILVFLSIKSFYLALIINLTLFFNEIGQKISIRAFLSQNL